MRRVRVGGSRPRNRRDRLLSSAETAIELTYLTQVNAWFAPWMR